MSICTLLENVNYRVYNGLVCASISSFVTIPSSVYLTNYVLRKFDLYNCKESKKALTKQFNIAIAISAIFGFLYGYNLDTKQKRLLN